MLCVIMLVFCSVLFCSWCWSVVCHCDGSFYFGHGGGSLYFANGVGRSYFGLVVVRCILAVMAVLSFVAMVLVVLIWPWQRPSYFDHGVGNGVFDLQF